ncbi:O-antigen polysaccharide polymerase Wzy family protein [[Clostridium] symbiosum]|uniref:O-antigen polysaccharide polymerase Wzy n=2 Tax=Clostridia TaxID=186801 RepID=A0ABC9TW60_CLOSY|nr:O-antigen polysaccharide polymerase Wzy family protein [[Clostridium] symbiosum]ERI75889.1 hypothetical protein CLOSYM_02954 [[Clostridium] symbiosum ATCC 14940]MCQ4990435.1 O-antigen polysaccharide polymerase Wzy family protein [[Clostridium] symbiosum]MDB2037860.1 O-antigen polysaccharide polymerase Wzy family protein [[Clostridium] symbiosum]MDM8134710.1 O-antigen polysaccharide polymerase Wzy family protein [[Clostridium] symbiosum]MDM8138746.1 O-antigen polysaccharide polymerase Wzy fa
MKKIYKLWTAMQYFSIICSAIFLFLFLVTTNQYHFFLISIIALWVSNLSYSFLNIHRRILFFFFHITFFVFILGRPLISFIRGEDWFNYSIEHYYTGADTFTALVIIFLALLFLEIGAMVGNQVLLKQHKYMKFVDSEYKRIYLYSVRVVSQILFFISMISTLMLGWEKIIFMRGHTYIDYYVSFKSQYPYIIYVISTFTKFSLYFYLATLPSKKHTFVPLVLYILSAVPSLIVGERNPIVLNTIFALIYYVVRDYYGSKEKWIGYFEKMLMICCIPTGLIFLGMINYLREGISDTFSSASEIIIDLVFKQGVTFSWLCSGLGALDKLPDIQWVNYTFGGIIDYFRYGSIGQLVSGTSGLGTGNNILKATHGNSMAHHLSYVLLQEEYLEGHGCGSSFLLEVYADYKYIGIIIFSCILGFFLIYVIEFSRKGIIQSVFFLSCIHGILFMPRAEAIGGISFLMHMPFWCTLIACWAGALLLTRRYCKRKIVFEIG